jgi:hypothetical protein
MATAAALVIVLAAAGISIGLLGSQPRPSVSACTVSGGQGTAPVIITPDQAQNATIIAAVGVRKGMPDHAVTVALATALQESHLMNLPYGDRDSLGLFQQRPSQGWGTSTQILDPAYAAGAFYDRLVQVPGWQTLPVTEAAQLVQSSATPSAYGNWEPEARALAIAATGERPAALTCQLNAFGGSRPADAALAAAAATEFGPHALANPSSTKVGWQYATWAVAHAYNYHLTSVSYDGLQWTWNSTSTAWSSAPMSTSVVTTMQ